MSDAVLISPATYRTMKELLDSAVPITTLKEMKKLLVEQALVRCHGNKTQAAKLIGVSLRSMRNYIREFGLVQFSGMVPYSQVKRAKCPK